MKSAKSSALLVSICVLVTLASLTARAQDAAVSATHGINVARMDRTVKPGDDFYEFTNGTWLKTTEIPSDRASIGVFTALDVIANQRTHDLIDEVAKSPAPAGTPERRIADLYNSYMNEAAIESKGIAPIKPHLDAIAAIHDKRELARALGETLRADVDALNNAVFHTANLFGLWVAPNFNDSEHYVGYLMQGGCRCRAAIITLLTARACANCALNIRRMSPRSSSSPASLTRMRVPRVLSNSNTPSLKLI